MRFRLFSISRDPIDKRIKSPPALYNLGKGQGIRSILAPMGSFSTLLQNLNKGGGTTLNKWTLLVVQGQLYKFVYCPKVHITNAHTATTKTVFCVI